MSLAPCFRSQDSVELWRIVRRQDADEQLVRRRRIGTALVQRRFGWELVTPDVRGQEGARKRTADAARVVTEVEIRQCVDADFGRVGGVPAPADEDGVWFHSMGAAFGVSATGDVRRVMSYYSPARL